MPKLTKLNLNDLKIESFQTSNENAVKGGTLIKTKHYMCNSVLVCSDTEPAWKCMQQSIGHCTNYYQICPNPNL